LNIPTFAMVDTNANPKDVDFAIPSNDDAAKSIELIVKAMADAVAAGLAERKAGKDKEVEAKAETKEAKVEATKEVAAEAPTEDKKEG
jgi:small subunit ribosomal protein S2